jgi:hypothetical protein
MNTPTATTLRKAETAIDELTGDIIDGRISGVRATYIELLIEGFVALKTEMRRVPECACEERTGWTGIRCCNFCGYPLSSENWHTGHTTTTKPTGEQ